MTETTRYTIGLDVGGTKIAAGLVEFPGGRILVRHRVPTAAHLGGAQVLDTCVRLSRSLLAEAESHGVCVSGIGLGIAEMVNLAGQLSSNETIDWRGLDPAAHFAGLPTLLIDSDARAGALAEARLGHGCSFSTFLYITVGTGISYAFVLEGKPYTGTRGNAIVFANSPQAFCFECRHGSAYTLETYAAGPALVRRYVQIGGVATGAEEVIAAAASGEPRALDVVTSAAEALAAGVATLVNALDPEAVVLGGGLGTAPGIYWEHFLSRVRQSIWAPGTRDLPILQSALGADAGLLGAATLALTID
jgi:predicted NBD/HSP70 family sugar kinase